LFLFGSLTEKTTNNCSGAKHKSSKVSTSAGSFKLTNDKEKKPKRTKLKKTPTTKAEGVISTIATLHSASAAVSTNKHSSSTSPYHNSSIASSGSGVKHKIGKKRRQHPVVPPAHSSLLLLDYDKYMDDNKYIAKTKNNVNPASSVGGVKTTSSSSGFSSNKLSSKQLVSPAKKRTNNSAGMSLSRPLKSSTASGGGANDDCDEIVFSMAPLTDNQNDRLLQQTTENQNDKLLPQASCNNNNSSSGGGGEGGSISCVYDIDAKNYVFCSGPEVHLSDRTVPRSKSVASTTTAAAATSFDVAGATGSGDMKSNSLKCD